jgi:hypothetical protein
MTTTRAPSPGPFAVLTTGLALDAMRSWFDLVVLVVVQMRQARTRIVPDSVDKPPQAREGKHADEDDAVVVHAGGCGGKGICCSGIWSVLPERRRRERERERESITYGSSKRY